MTEVIPGILEKDFSAIKRKIEMVKDYVDWIEIDILDHTLYPNDTYNNWEAFRLYSSEINLAAHLMVSDPLKHINPLKNSGFKRLVADVEGDTVRDFVNETKLEGLEVGVALNGPSPLELVEPFLNEVDMVLFMTIEAGFSGRPFMPSVLTKIKKIHEEYPQLPIQVDGGISDKTAAEVIKAGATRLVSTSYLFWENPHRIEAAIVELKKTE